MTDAAKLSKLENLKQGSHQLRGSITEELANDEPTFSGDAAQLLKHHGTYCQTDRDFRGQKNPDGTPAPKRHIMMVRTRIPGGRVTAEQLLAELVLCDEFANGTLRITTRQGLQLHGVLKRDLKQTIAAINRTKLTTLAACGDVERNVMCCPAPIHNSSVRAQMQRQAFEVAEHLKPRTTSYCDIWLKDDQGNSERIAEFQPVEEPIYGARYLPRKFKTAFALPDDNCVDIYTQDLGFLAVVENDYIVGYNVIVGGGMGTKPSQEKCYPAVGKRLTFVRPEEVVPIAETIVKVQRDHGNREDRQTARLKYLIAGWGLDRFKATVEGYYGQSLPEPHPTDVTGVEDHMGWHEQGDGRWYLGINVENGRIKDEGDLRLKTGLRAVVERYRMPTRMTPLQGIILCDIESGQRSEIDRMLSEHGVRPAEELSLVRRYSMACPAFPTCGLSLAESERVMPQVIDSLEQEVARLQLDSEKIAVHMTGCPNGCARPYTPDIGLVGKTKGKYTLFLGGNAEGTRLGFIYQDLVPLDEIVPTLTPLLERYARERGQGESFGDYCNRIGAEQLGAA